MPNSTPEPPEPVPVYTIPDPAAQAEGTTSNPLNSGEPDKSRVIHILIPSMVVNTNVFQQTHNLSIEFL